MQACRSQRSSGTPGSVPGIDADGYREAVWSTWPTWPLDGVCRADLVAARLVELAGDEALPTG